jgi:putative DNA primase/helicase
MRGKDDGNGSVQPSKKPGSPRPPQEDKWHPPYDEMIEILHGLAVAKLANPLAYKLEVFPEGMKKSGFGKRELEALVKPIYDRLAARAAAEGGDDAAPGQRDQVHEIGLACGLFCDADREGYATIELAGHRETCPVRSTRFRQYVLGEFKRRYGRLAAGTALSEGIEAIAAAAAEGPVREVFVRLAGDDGKIYLDLCRDDWKVVEIDVGGWRVLDASPVPFLRSVGLRPLPVPRREAGALARLRGLVNIPEDDDHKDDWILLVSWFVGALRPCGPYPFLITDGPPGAGKTSAGKIARQLIDPAHVVTAAPPKSEDDLVIAAKHAWVPTYDNLRLIDDDLADALCRLATGGGLQKRKLHTDQDQVLMAVCRPVILNGITDLAARDDVADRSIVSTLPVMPEEGRRLEKRLAQEFAEAAPGILGALLDGVVAALKGSDDEERAMVRKPRMADFAVWAAAAASAFGWTSADFYAAYERNRLTRAQRVVEADPVARTLYELTQDKAWETLKGQADGEWSGTPTELLALLDRRVSKELKRTRRWPKDPGWLGRRLNEAERALRAVGIVFAQFKSGDRKIKLVKMPPLPS